MDLVRRISGLAMGDLPQAGGKGAQLGELVRAGLPVPPGFVLLTPAYKAFVEANGLQPEIERLAAPAHANPGDAGAAETASLRIRELFERGQMPGELDAALRQAYGEMGGTAVAVRSSATAEDLPGASFAGQQETYLNIRGEEALLAAVRRCWSSLWTPRAISYRARQAIAPDEVALAVVVQELVAAKAAGVLFTANPLNGRRDHMAIDGAWGLGESVVSGQVLPDHWVVDRTSGALVEERISRKEVMTVRVGPEGAAGAAAGSGEAGSGVATVPVPSDLQERPVLDRAAIAALVEMGRRAEEHFGSFQDLEWALTDRGLCLLQSRPITALFPLPEPRPGAEAGLRVYISFNYLQGILEPFTPAGRDLFRYLAKGPAWLLGFKIPPGQLPTAVTEAGERLYIDVTTALRHHRFRRLVLAAPEMIDKPTALILRGLAEREPRLQPGPVTGPKPRLGYFLKVVARALYGIINPAGIRRYAHATAAAEIEQLEAKAESLQGFAEMQRFVQEGAAGLFPAVMGALIPAVVGGQAGRFQAERLLAKWLGTAQGLKPVMRSVPYNPTTEMDLALWRLSRQLKAAGEEPSAAHPLVQAFLSTYGHRGVREIDMGMPRWWDDPTHILNILATYLTHGEEADAEAHFRRGEAEAMAAVAALVAQVRTRKGPLHAAVMRFLLSRMRELSGLREFPKFSVVRCIAIFRRVLARAGAALAAEGRLERPDDVFFLRFAELTSPGDLRALAAERRTEYRREMERRHVPRVLTSDGGTFYAAPVTAQGGLSGAPVSPGVYEGKARVIHDPHGARLEPGEVLVAPGTDPAWTPLFLSAGALVMEIGGMMSHGSVVAREYGIPAVVGVVGATQRIRTGQRIRVDGENGLVVPLEE